MTQIATKSFLLPVDEETNTYMSSLSLEVRQKVNKRNIRKQIGATNGPIICKGIDVCPFAEHCPLLNLIEEDEYPINQQCVLETEYLRNSFESLTEHLQVDALNPIEVSIVSELSIIDLLKNRINMIISSKAPDMLLTNRSVTGFVDGSPLLSETTVLHPLADYADKLEKRRQSWLTDLMETRREKAHWSLKAGNLQTKNKILEALETIKGQLGQSAPEEIIEI